MTGLMTIRATAAPRRAGSPAIQATRPLETRRNYELPLDLRFHIARAAPSI